MIALSMVLALACNRVQPKRRSQEAASQPSPIKVETASGGPLVLTTSAAAFEIGPSGYIQAFLLRDGKRLTLDEPKLGQPDESDYLVQDGKEIHFVLEFDQAKVLEAVGKLGREKSIRC